MDKTNLVEIKKGQTGTGILIEHDGYISKDCGDNKQLFESIQRLNENAGDGEFYCPNPFIVSAVFQKFDVKNGNGRIYPEKILKREVERYINEKVSQKWAYGELNHPSDTVIDGSRIAINIVELHWEGKTLVGKLEIITSQGFRKHGIISCQGDQVANILLHGLKIGVSSRGLGSVYKKFGETIVGDDFEIVCWDVVTDPSTPGAWIDENPENLQMYKEEKEENKKNLIENLKKFDDWLLN